VKKGCLQLFFTAIQGDGSDETDSKYRGGYVAGVAINICRGMCRYYEYQRHSECRAGISVGGKSNNRNAFDAGKHS
jgi:hypothetical protein